MIHVIWLWVSKVNMSFAIFCLCLDEFIPIQWPCNCPSFAVQIPTTIPSRTHLEHIRWSYTPTINHRLRSINQIFWWLTINFFGRQHHFPSNIFFIVSFSYEISHIIYIYKYQRYESISTSRSINIINHITINVHNYVNISVKIYHPS
jgi:hypothetical protein